MIVLFITAVLLSVSSTAAQVEHIRNFQVSSQTGTHITFSWDIVDGYYNSSSISQFRLMYEDRLSYYYYYTYTRYINYRDTTLNVSVDNVATFKHTTLLEYFTSSNQYIMWIRVSRSSSLYPRDTYSERLYVRFSQTDFVLELKFSLHPTQVCSDFLDNATLASIPGVSRDVYWFLLDSCQTECPFLPWYKEEVDGYYTCAPSDYVIFRAKFSSRGAINDVPFDLTLFMASLTSMLSRQDRNFGITVNGRRYVISPGPCGLTIPHLDSPHCFNESSGFEEAPDTDQAVTSSLPQENTTAASTDSSQPLVTHDSTAVVAIVGAMCGATMILVLSGCILVLLLFMRMKEMPTKGTPHSCLHWNSGLVEDTPWVLSPANHQVDSSSQQGLTAANESVIAEEM